MWVGEIAGGNRVAVRRDGARHRRHSVAIRAAVLAALGIAAAAAPRDPAAAATVVQTQAGAVSVERLAALTEPWGMAFLPDGRLLITEKPGRLRIYSGGTLSEPISGVPEVAYYGQGGLLDVEIGPDFARSGLVYLSYAEPAEQQPLGALDPGDPRLGPDQDTGNVVLKGGAVARGRLDGTSLRDVTVIWRQFPKTIGRGHFGGRLCFAPNGKLFITSGERQRFEPAQDLTSNLGKIVRINADGSIPRDNPFARKKRARADLWSLGHRNPLGAAIHPKSKRLWIHEMGPWNGDEINVPKAGKNYGWPLVSKGKHYDGTAIPGPETQPKFAAPGHFWDPAVSPSGLAFYTGNRFAAWRGNALLGGLSSMALIRLTLSGERVKSEERIFLQRRIRDVIQAPDGAVLLLTDGMNGELLRLTPALE
jgi:glucose/arabinose dehydrogenase